MIELKDQEFTIRLSIFFNKLMKHKTLTLIYKSLHSRQTTLKKNFFQRCNKQFFKSKEIIFQGNRLDF